MLIHSQDESLIIGYDFINILSIDQFFNTTN